VRALLSGRSQRHFIRAKLVAKDVRARSGPKRDMFKMVKKGWGGKGAIEMNQQTMGEKNEGAQ
jgi:hypothetical protein